MNSNRRHIPDNVVYGRKLIDCPYVTSVGFGLKGVNYNLFLPKVVPRSAHPRDFNRLVTEQYQNMDRLVNLQGPISKIELMFRLGMLYIWARKKKQAHETASKRRDPNSIYSYTEMSPTTGPFLAEVYILLKRAGSPSKNTFWGRHVINMANALEDILRPRRSEKELEEAFEKVRKSPPVHEGTGKPFTEEELRGLVENMRSREYFF